MNYYERHVGDYLKDTAHLSLLEHGVYGRLLDVYYTREAPLPADQIARLIGARSKDERAALDAVLAEFFVRNADAWEQARCDREIARYKDKRAKAKRSAETRWSQTEGSANDMRTHTEGNALQSPDTSNQTPDPSTKTRLTKEVDEAFEQAWIAYPSRSGQSKAGALKAWQARIKAGDTPEAMIEGVRRYADYCEATKTEQRFIKHAATFFGPDRHFLTDWTPPQKTPQGGMRQPPPNRYAGAAAAIFGHGDDRQGSMIDV